jgi:hypothetical protein
LETKEELLQWMDQLLPNELDYLQQAGASYSPEIREFEAILRPLWGILPSYFSGEKNEKSEYYLKKFVTLVEQQELPQLTTKNRQIAVEMGVLGYGLGQFKGDFLTLFTTTGQNYLVKWLNSINEIEFPEGNWYFFLVLVNTALKQNQLPYSDKRLTLALKKIDSFYLGDGWYSDGPNQQRDYYVAFAFHFYGLLYSRITSDSYSEKFVARAVTFAEDFKYWFDEAGRSLPFGRSLTYRFAHVSFWSALVLTKAYQKTSLSLGEVKHLILENFRFWQKQPLVLPKEQNLSVGYGYNQAVMAEDYNAPGSPMWAFKAFVLLELPANDTFWQAAEQKIPKKAMVTQKYAGFQIATSVEQTTALSNRQYSGNPLLYHGKEKYSKFAYSTYFGFNVSRDNQFLEQTAIDSTLAISVAGHNQYQVRGEIQTMQSDVDYTQSLWKVWDEVKIQTTLVPLSADTHVRIQRIVTPYAIDVVEGGFPLHSWNKKQFEPLLTDTTCELLNPFGRSAMADLRGNRKARVVTQGPNTNLYSPEKNGVPSLQVRMAPGSDWFACLVHGSPSGAPLPKVSIEEVDNNVLIRCETGKTIQVTIGEGENL